MESNEFNEGKRCVILFVSYVVVLQSSFSSTCDLKKAFEIVSVR